MKTRIYSKLYVLSLLIVISVQVNAQATQRKRPAEWSNLVDGGRFIDRFLLIPPTGKLTYDTWGAAGVIPRYVDNGIEDKDWSYWGGKILVDDDGKYHLFVCRWREDSPKGHREWSNSIVVHTVSDNSIGPYKVVGTIGKGHNPEAFRLKDGRYVIYVINGRYVANDINGPWTYGKFEFNPRDRRIIEGLSNLSFAQREDGSYVMICRGGGIWISKDGISPYNQLTDKRVYPDVDGRFEDPVIWRDNVQYNMIVNDWLGRIAYYLRSKDGIHWKVDPGEAYTPEITKYTDGTNEDWFKYERIKILQDEYGRAVQANFAVIDTLKRQDKSNDNHSSKNISIPLNKGVLMTILNQDKIDDRTKSIRVKIKVEKDFDPQTAIDMNSLRFGASEEVNFGRGSKVVKTEKLGDDLIVTFEGEGNGLTKDNFAAKLIGKTKDGELLYGYARFPWLDYLKPALSSLLPVLKKTSSGYQFEVEVQNFGQVASQPSAIKVEQVSDGNKEIASGKIPALKPFEKTTVKMKCDKIPDENSNVKVILYPEGQAPETLEGKLKKVS
ncbi:MAG: glycoside hydrolase family protein [Prolixibacteraceae bacterium]|jgi:hypothetical protein|nr:glycoside hydrolase family protein [Prolixibacteraceae bacterium]